MSRPTAHAYPPAIDPYCHGQGGDPAAAPMDGGFGRGPASPAVLITETGDGPAYEKICGTFFSGTIELDDPDVLVPLTANGNWRDSRVRFKVTITADDPESVADRVLIRVLKNDKPIFTQERNDFLRVGTHIGPC